MKKFIATIALLASFNVHADQFRTLLSMRSFDFLSGTSNVVEVKLDGSFYVNGQLDSSRWYEQEAVAVMLNLIDWIPENAVLPEAVFDENCGSDTAGPLVRAHGPQFAGGSIAIARMDGCSSTWTVVHSYFTDLPAKLADAIANPKVKKAVKAGPKRLNRGQN